MNHSHAESSQWPKRGVPVRPQPKEAILDTSNHGAFIVSRIENINLRIVFDVTSNLAEKIYVDYSKLRLLGRLDPKLYAMISDFASRGCGRCSRQVEYLIRCAIEDDEHQSAVLPQPLPHWPERASIRTVPLPCPSLVVSHIRGETLQLIVDVTSDHGLKVQVANGDLGLLMGLNPKMQEMIAEFVNCNRFSSSQVSYYSRCVYKPPTIPRELSGVHIKLASEEVAQP